MIFRVFASRVRFPFWGFRLGFFLVSTHVQKDRMTVYSSSGFHCSFLSFGEESKKIESQVIPVKVFPFVHLYSKHIDSYFRRRNKTASSKNVITVAHFFLCASVC